MKICFDAHVSLKIVEFLKYVYRKHTFEHIHSKFGKRVEDIDWITRLSDEGEWLAVTGDLRIYRNSSTRNIFENSNLKMIFLHDGFTEIGKKKQACKIVCWTQSFINFHRNSNNAKGVYFDNNGSKHPLSTITRRNAP